jgi:hypothetical protein
VAEKRYVGKGWMKKFDNGGAVINVSLKIDQLKVLTPNEYGDVCIVVGERREPDSKSKATHWAAVDDFKHPPAGEGESTF